jgi:beta-N-acetylhexosaminidase
MLPVFLGIPSGELGADERAFIADATPAGFILFGRNCRTRPQLRRLTDDLRELTGRDDLPILTDQEGGRVARLGPPEWPEFPAAWRFAELYDKAPMSAIEAARANAEAIATVLAEAGINVDCMPVLDLRRAETHDVIGDRALGAEPMQAAALGRAMLDGLAAGGVCGVVKHVPGHGRAAVDSHKELPVVEAGAAELEEDMAPFRTLRDAPMAMTAHLLYRAWDPIHCASLSPTIIADVIRGRIGFDGLLMSDDLAMGALSGGIGERGRAAIAAGCDVVLSGSGRMADNVALAAALPTIGETARLRLDKAMAGIRGRASASGLAALTARRDALLAHA